MTRARNRRIPRWLLVLVVPFWGAVWWATRDAPEQAAAPPSVGTNCYQRSVSQQQSLADCHWGFADFADPPVGDFPIGPIDVARASTELPSVEGS